LLRIENPWYHSSCVFQCSPTYEYNKVSLRCWQCLWLNWWVALEDSEMMLSKQLEAQGWLSRGRMDTDRTGAPKRLEVLRKSGNSHRRWQGYKRWPCPSAGREPPMT